MAPTLSRRTFLGAATAAVAAASLPAKAQNAPKRPNIVIIMADDMGYSDIGCYGGEVQTPNLDRLAAKGMRFTQFYNNAKCSPTRASLLTGLYSQQTGCFNGPNRLANCATIAEVLRPAGYRTYMAGKWHQDQLPTERGFDRYYGMCDGCSNFFNPGVQREGEPKPAEKSWPRKFSKDGEVMEPYTPASKTWYSTDAFTDAAIDYLAVHDASEPFLLYLAYTAPHYPLHAFPEDIAKYRGKYLKGWDAIRKERHARMIEMGIVDAAWPLSPRDERIPAWEDVEKREAWDLKAMNDDKPQGLHWEDARDRDMWDLKMAVYAAMIDRMDRNIGRLVAQLETMGVLDDTLVLFLADNGGCAETVHLTPGVAPGPLESYRTVDPPWANVQNTPFRYFKRYDHEGGISTPLVAHWPNRVPAGTITKEAGHLIDLMATCVDLAGADYPATMNGEAVLPCEGKSLVPVLEGGTRAGHESICWSFAQCRAIRQGKWKLVMVDGAPWELYDIEADRTEMNNRVSGEPDRAAAMAAAWDAWAERCNVLNGDAGDEA